MFLTHLELYANDDNLNQDLCKLNTCSRNRSELTYPKTNVWSDISITLTISMLMALRIWGPSSKDANRSSDNTVIKTCISCLRELRETERANGSLENTANIVSVRQFMSRRTVASGCWLDSTFGMWVVRIIFSCREAAFRNWNEI